MTELLTIEGFTELVHSRRSIRGFDQKRDVSDEQIESILETARWAPSGGNGQPWEFIVIRDRDKRHAIADLYLKQLEDKKEMEKALRGYTKMPGDGFRHAPVHILVVGDPRVNASYPVRTILDKGDRHFFSGLANACYAMHLAARALGLGAQYMSDAGSPYMSTMLKVMLGIPDPLVVYELIPIGYTHKWPNATPRRPLKEIIHRERYEPEKYRDEAKMNEFLFGQSRIGSFGNAAKAKPGQEELSPEELRQQADSEKV